MSTKKKAGNDWLQEIIEQERLSGEPEIVPDGWLNLVQIAERMGCTFNSAEPKMKRLIKTGKAERKQFRVHVQGTGLKLVWHYNKKQ